MDPKKNQKLQKSGAVLTEKAPIDRQKLMHIILFASVAVITLAMFIVGGIFIAKGAKERAAEAEKRRLEAYYDRLDSEFDFLTSDLTPYLVVTPDLYQNIKLTVSLDSVTEEDVSNRILQTLAKHKGEKLTEIPTGRVLSAGDVVRIYYRGYTVAADGKEVEFSGGNNMSSDTPASLELGSGDFIPGFELALVGIDPADYPFSKETKGKIEPTDVIYVSYTAFMPSGEKKQTKERIDLTDPELADNYGDDFLDKMLAASAGETIGTFTCKMGTRGSAVYSDFKIEFTMREAKYITVDAYFPYDYGKGESGNAQDLAATKVKFDVYLVDYVGYEAAELNDDFILNTLEQQESDFDEFAGDTLVEKYRARVRADLDEEYEKAKEDLIRTEMFNYYNDHAKVTRLPSYHVRAIYEEQYEELKQYYGASLGTTDESSEAFQTLRNYALAYARTSVTETLVFYAVLRHTGLLPALDSAEFKVEYDRLLDEAVEDYLSYYGITAESFSPKDGKTAEEIFREKVETYYRPKVEEQSKDAITEDVFYNAAIETLESYVKVTVIDARTAEKGPVEK